MENLILNLTDLNCPLPILKTKKFISNLASGVRIIVITTDPAAQNDFKTFCNKTGHLLIKQDKDGDRLTTVIEVVK